MDTKYEPDLSDYDVGVKHARQMSGPQYPHNANYMGGYRAGKNPDTEHAALRAENERLREALRGIELRSGGCGESSTASQMDDDLLAVNSSARAALAGGTEYHPRPASTITGQLTRAEVKTLKGDLK